jgi:hypothetical protein
MRVLDLDQDGLISQDELATAIRFLRDNLDEGDLNALLHSLAIRSEEAQGAVAAAPTAPTPAPGEAVSGGAKPLISVEQLRRLAEASSSSGGGQGGNGAGVSAGAAQALAPPEAPPAVGDPPKDSTQIHILWIDLGGGRRMGGL